MPALAGTLIRELTANLLRSHRWRQAKLGEGGRDVTITPRKPFVGALRVEARPVAPDQRPEASLAWGGATRTAKRRQRVRKPCYGASKVLSQEPLPFDDQGPCRGTVGVWCPRSCRRRCGTCENGQSGFPKNL